MKKLIITLTIAFMSFSVNADEKSRYFAKNCLKELFANKDQTKNKIVEGTISYFKLMDLNNCIRGVFVKGDYLSLQS